MADPAPPVAAMAIFDSIDVDLPHNAPMQEVHDALQNMDLAVCTIHSSRPVHVMKKVNSYASVDQRIRAFNLWKERNAEVAAKFTAEEWAIEEATYGILTDVVRNAVQRNTFIMAATMQNMVFSHSFTAKLYEIITPGDREIHRRRDSAWHEFGVLLQDRVVSCFLLAQPIFAAVLTIITISALHLRPLL